MFTATSNHSSFEKTLDTSNDSQVSLRVNAERSAAMNSITAASTFSKSKRLSVAAQLAATSERDAQAIDGLKRGETWTKIIVNANDVKCMDETPRSMRIYVERSIVCGVHLDYRLEIQNGDWQWESYSIGGVAEEGHKASGTEMTLLYPFWGELAERHITVLREEHQLSAWKEQSGYEESGERLCHECGFESGATYAFPSFDRSQMESIARCPLCENVRWLSPLRDWDNLPDEMVQAVREKAGGQTVELKVAA